MLPECLLKFEDESTDFFDEKFSLWSMIDLLLFWLLDRSSETYSNFFDDFLTFLGFFSSNCSVTNIGCSSVSSADYYDSSSA